MSKYSDRVVPLDEPNNSLTIIYNWIDEGTNVLDVGCDEGYFARTLKNNKKNKVWGLEVNPDAAKAAREVCEIVVENDLDDKEPFKGLDIKFDYIVFADVLEHTKNPSYILEKAKEKLSENGKILISIPNIAHLSARLELLNGSFEYEKTGIFDDTHLKYFTLKTFTDLLIKAGFTINEFAGVLRDIPNNVISNMLQGVGLKVTDKFLAHSKSFEMQAYQLIFNIEVNTSPNKAQSKKDIRKAFKPMTIADDSVIYLRNKVKELENTIEEYDKNLRVAIEQREELKKKLS